MAGIRLRGNYTGSNTSYDAGYGDELDASRNPNFEWNAEQGIYTPRQVNRPEWRVSPTGEVWQAYGSDDVGETRGWKNTGNSAFGALSGFAAGAGSGGGGGGAGAGAGSGGPALIDYTPDEDADRAARTGAKERAGKRLQSSMKGLDAFMSGRGIRGSGLQGKGAQELFAASASDEAESERGRLDQNARRRFEVTNRNQDARNRWSSEQNDLAMRAAERADRLAQGQQSLALQLMQFGMRY